MIILKCSWVLKHLHKDRTGDDYTNTTKLNGYVSKKINNKLISDSINRQFKQFIVFIQ